VVKHTLRIRGDSHPITKRLFARLKPSALALAVCSLAVAQESRISNLAIRAETKPDQALIVGFNVGPGADKTVVIRAIGPTLQLFGVAAPLLDPRLELFSASGARLASNDDFVATDASVFRQVGAFELPFGAKDAAIVARLSPGGYTAHVTAPAGTSGTALLEVYEVGADGAPLTNLSARNYANTGGNSLIAGFSLNGSGPKRLLIRGVGPTLGQFGVTGALADPKIEVFSGTTRVADNDDWGSTPALNYAFGITGAFQLGSATRDAALETSLGPGGYTVHLSPASGSSGEALVEVYARPWVKLQSMNVPAAEPISPPAQKPIRLEDLVGVYRRSPYTNGAHAGTISFRPGSTTLLQWKNDGGWILNLEPDLPDNRLKTDSSNPYYEDPYGYGLETARNFRLEFQGGELIGFRFLFDLFVREGKKAVIPLPTGLYSYISMNPAESPGEYTAGVSYYTTIWPMLERPLNGFQLGLPATWIHPDNRTYAQALLPPDNAIRQYYPNAGPSWWGLWQTIEGSPGYWGNTQFFSTMPKYLMGPNPEGYDTAPNTPGFGWAKGSLGALPPEAMALAQLSNRLIIPADGFTFGAETSGEFFGVAWMALPLIDAKPTAPVPVGDQSWTFFANAANFRGPVAFVVPEAWTRLSARWAPAAGRGLDTQPGIAVGASMEINTVPAFEGVDSSGVKYSRIPRLRFPTTPEGTTYLISDWTTYSRRAIFAPMQNWLRGGAPVSGRFDPGGSHRPSLKAESSFWAFQDHQMKIPVNGWNSFLEQTVFPTPGGGTAFGLRWKGSGTQGVLPEYYREAGGRIYAIDAKDVPTETRLHTMTFPEPERQKPYVSPVGGDSGWDTPPPVSGPHTAKLNDGSTVTYYWYRFIDQPALKGFKWTAAERQQLQARVEQLHAAWANTPEFMAPPTGGALVTLDPAQLVSPPRGLEVGYVPFVTKQIKTP
jgi:hypothetical protein